jgi:hypothetical protein
MGYYKDTNNKLHFLEDNAYAYLLPDNVIQITNEEAETIRQESAPEKTKEQIIKEYQAAVQKRLDDFAQTRNYSGILSACTYSTSLVARFNAEGQYCVNARDTTWAKCYEILDAVNSNSRPMPTLEQLMSELPVLSWPN